MKKLCLFLIVIVSMGLVGCDKKKSTKSQTSTSVETVVTSVPAASGSVELVTLPSGLQYKVVKVGNGKTPKATDKVTVHYRGTFKDGREFDSSYKRGQPATFPVNGVIKGWTQALQMMKEGDKWELIIPSTLGYGPMGSPPVIPGNETLYFDVELLKVL